jgi:hypothetical protein
MQRLEADFLNPPGQFTLCVLRVMWCDTAGQLARHGADELRQDAVVLLHDAFDPVTAD